MGILYVLHKKEASWRAVFLCVCFWTGYSDQVPPAPNTIISLQDRLFLWTVSQNKPEISLVRYFITTMRWIINIDTFYKIQLLKSFPYLAFLLLGSQLLLAWHSGFSEIIHFCVYIFGFFETGSHVASAMDSRVTRKSLFFCFYLPSTGLQICTINSSFSKTIFNVL